MKTKDLFNRIEIANKISNLVDNYDRYYVYIDIYSAEFPEGLPVLKTRDKHVFNSFRFYTWREVLNAFENCRDDIRALLDNCTLKQIEASPTIFILKNQKISTSYKLRLSVHSA